MEDPKDVEKECCLTQDAKLPKGIGRKTILPQSSSMQDSARTKKKNRKHDGYV